MHGSPQNRLLVHIALHRYFPHGGLQRDALQTAIACAARGHRVTLHTQRFDGPRPAGIDVRVHAVAGRSNHARALAFARALGMASSGEPTGVLLGFDKLPGLDLYFAGDPCYAARVRRSRGPWVRLTPRYRAFHGLERAVFRPGARPRILLLDERERAHFQAEYDTEDCRFELLTPGVARDRAWTPESARVGRAARMALGVEDDQRLLLFVGSDFRRKGLDRVIHGIAALPDALRVGVRLVAAGQDDPTSMLRLAQRVGVAANVSIESGRDDVPALLAAADLLVHPARQEPGGLVLVEAIVAGLPVLCTGCCGFARYVEAAGAGVVLAEPFLQPAFDRELAALLAAPLAPYRDRALEFAARVDLHGMHERIADAVEVAAPSAG